MESNKFKTRLSILSFLMVFFSFSQSRKKQIENLELKVDSLSQVISNERTSNLVGSKELKLKIIDFQNQIQELKSDLMEKNAIIETKDILIEKFKINAKQRKNENDSLLALLKLKNEEMNKTINDYKNQIEQLRLENKIKTDELNQKSMESQISNQYSDKKTNGIDLLKKDGKLKIDSVEKLNNSSKIISSKTNTNNNLDNFKSIKIGTQEWMQQNLNVDKFRNGDLIQQAKTSEEWIYAFENEEPAWCYYNNDSKNGVIFGKLYNWFAVSDPRGLAPKGWHIASSNEWDALTEYSDAKINSNDQLVSKLGWQGDCKGKNLSGFSAMPGGTRYFSGAFSEFGYSGYWWSFNGDDWDPSNTHTACQCNIFSWYSVGYPDARGLSVRCVKD